MERAVPLLRDVFDFSYSEISVQIDKSEAACRQLLTRARRHVASERRVFTVSHDEHRRILAAFLEAAAGGSVGDLMRLLATDATLIADAGPEGGSFGRVRNLPGPIVEAAKVAAFVAAVTPQGSQNLTLRPCELNGEPAALVLRDGCAYAAILLSIADERIRAASSSTRTPPGSGTSARNSPR
jgi:RNA polymerase sigma-70 factor (ECF subfamily)